MNSKQRLDLIEVLTASDGDYDENIGAYVSAYPLNEFDIQFELEYTDRDNEDEVVEIARFVVSLPED